MSISSLGWLAFISALVVRSIFVLNYPLNSFEFYPEDSHEYVTLADRALHGNFNFDLERFIRAPLYPIFITLHKWLLGTYWQQGLIISQLLLASLTGVFLFRISMILFSNRRISACVALLFAIYLPVFYYVYSFTSETLFMFLNVLAFHLLLRFAQQRKRRYLLLYGITFTFSYLTRAEILLFLPFAIFLIFYVNYPSWLRATAHASAVVGCWILLTLPWGVTNYKLHHQYITSSNGGLFVFYLSNSEIGYADIVDTPPQDSPAYDSLMSNYNYYDPKFDSIMKLPAQIRQDVFLHRSIEWAYHDPQRFLAVKIWNAVNFFTPGLTIGHHDETVWWIMFLFCLPFHLLFYTGVILLIHRIQFKYQLAFFGYWLSSFGFLVIFLYHARFRVYSIEVFYLLFAGFAFNWLVTNLRKRTSAANFAR